MSPDEGQSRDEFRPSRRLSRTEGARRESSGNHIPFDAEVKAADEFDGHPALNQRVGDNAARSECAAHPDEPDPAAKVEGVIHLPFGGRQHWPNVDLAFLAFD